MNQYCIYLRKSRSDAEAEQRGEGETLARHEKTLFELARRQNLNVTEVYREIVSGETIAARPVMQQLLSDIGEGIWAGVIVMEIERLARGDTIDQGIVAQAFKYSDTKIITPAKTYDPNNEFDEEYFEFGLFMSRREYKVIKRRLLQGRIASVKEGKWLQQAPYGYRRVKLENDKGYTLTPDPAEAEIVKLIFSLYTEGETLESGEKRRCGMDMIARKLNQLKIPPSRHDYWMKATIRDILKNPAYKGKVAWGRHPQNKKTVNGIVTISRSFNKDYLIADGLHPAIIDEVTFDLVQRYIEELPPMPIGYKKDLKNPIAGIVKCGKCGRNMVYRREKSEGKPSYLVCHARACDNISSPLHFVEERILALLQDWLNSYRLDWEPEEGNGKVVSSLKTTALNTIKNEISTLEKQLNKAYDFLEQEIYSTDEFLTRTKTINANIEKAKREHAELEKSLGAEIMRDENRRTIIPKVEYLLKVYNDLPTPADKNVLLKEVIEKAVYIKTAGGQFRGNSPDGFELKIFPRIPYKD